MSTVARISFYKEVVFILHLSRQQKYTSYGTLHPRCVVVSFYIFNKLMEGIMDYSLMTRLAAELLGTALLIVLG